MKMTSYFRDVVRRKQPEIETSWILLVMAEPLEERQQPDGRYAVFRSQPPPPQALPPSR